MKTLLAVRALQSNFNSGVCSRSRVRTARAFAAVLKDGSVITWGDHSHGGDSSRVQDQLVSVQQVHATDGAFLAILADGSVVTWGNPQYGGKYVTVS